MGALGEIAHRRRGNAAVIVAISLIVILAAAALGTDIAWLVESSRELRTAADASALAGVRVVRDDQDQARDITHDISAANEAAEAPVLLNLNSGNDANGDIVFGRWDGTVFEPVEFGPNAVKVVARKTSTSASGPIFPILGQTLGYQYHEMQREAIALVTGSTGDGIIALCPDCQCSFRLSGGGTQDPSLDVGNGAIQVNSNNHCAACGNGHASVAVGEMNIVSDHPQSGGQCFNGQADIYGDVNSGVDPVPDPLEDLPNPVYDPALDLSCSYSSDATLTAGYYSVGIQHTGGSLTLSPGNYILGLPLSTPTSGSIDFDNSADEAGVTMPGETDFVHDGMTWTGGTVVTIPVGSPATYPLAASGTYSYHIDPAGGNVTVEPAVDSVTFFYVHDDTLGIAQGSATAVDLCGTTLDTVTSIAATTFNDPLNYVTLNGGAFPISRIDFTGGVIDAVAFNRIVGDEGLHVTGNSSIDIQESMVFLQSGGVQIGGNATYSVTPPSTGEYEHISFFQARDNTASAKFLGTSVGPVEGTFYFPAALLEVGGTAETFSNGLIAWEIWMHGDGYMKIDYDGFMGDPDLQTFLVK